MERNSQWSDTTPYGRETVQGVAKEALILPKDILRQYRELASAFALINYSILENWDTIIRTSDVAMQIWNKFGPLQKSLFNKSKSQIITEKMPFSVRFDSTVSPEGKIAIFESEIQNCGDGPLIQKTNEYGRDKTINPNNLLNYLQNYLTGKDPITVTRSKDKMTFYWPTIKTLSLGLTTLGLESIPSVLEDLTIKSDGVYWTPGESSEKPDNLLTSPSWYDMKDTPVRINTIYNQLGTSAIFYPNPAEQQLIESYCNNLVDIFPTPNPLIASKAILALIWDNKTRQVLNQSPETALALRLMRLYTPPSYLGSKDCPVASEILPAIVKPIFGAKQQGISIIGRPSQLDKYLESADFVIQKWVSPYRWVVEKENDRPAFFNTRLEAFCWFQGTKGEVVDFLATGSISNIVGGNRTGPMTTVYFS